MFKSSSINAVPSIVAAAGSDFRLQIGHARFHRPACERPRRRCRRKKLDQRSVYRAPPRCQIPNRPIVRRWLRQFPVELRGPSTVVSLQTSFFIACSGFTQGPPVSLQPAELKIAISKPNRSASAAACRTASSHSGRAKQNFLLHRLSAAGGNIRQLHSANANALHPLQIFGDAFFGHIAVGPVPPGARLGRIGRILETVFKISRPDSGRTSSGSQPQQYYARRNKTRFTWAEEEPYSISSIDRITNYRTGADSCRPIIY